MQVVDMMRKTVHTATADMSLAQAQHRMQEHRVRHLPVVAQTHLIGLLTDRDLRDALPSAVTTLGPAEIAQHLDTIAVETCMTTPVKTISSTADAVDAARQLLQTHYGCLPVVDHEKLVGIVTELDMFCNSNATPDKLFNVCQSWAWFPNGRCSRSRNNQCCGSLR